MDFVGMGLLVALFVVNALAIDFIYNEKYKRAGFLNIAALCLTVALAYNFKQMEDIMKVFLVLVIVAIAFFVLRFVLHKRKANKTKIETQTGEKDQNN